MCARYNKHRRNIAVIYLLSLVQLFVTPWTVAHQAPLCPWDSSGENTGVGSHFLLQGIFPIQGSNLSFLHWQADSLPLSHQGSHKHPSGAKHFIQFNFRFAGELVITVKG